MLVTPIGFRITQLVFPVTLNEWMWTALKVAFELIFQDSSFKMVNLSSCSVLLPPFAHRMCERGIVSGNGGNAAQG